MADGVGKDLRLGSCWIDTSRGTVKDHRRAGRVPDEQQPAPSAPCHPPTRDSFHPAPFIAAGVLHFCERRTPARVRRCTAGCGAARGSMSAVSNARACLIATHVPPIRARAFADLPPPGRRVDRTCWPTRRHSSSSARRNGCGGSIMESSETIPNPERGTQRRRRHYVPGPAPRRALRERRGATCARPGRLSPHPRSPVLRHACA